MIQAQNWFDALHSCQQQGRSYVLVTLLATAGSTPRDGGTKMVVCDDCTFDTIGGGNLEHVVTRRARELLSTALASAGAKTNQQVVENFPLSSKLAQCCGGATNVLFEVFCRHSQHLAVYGAGHVAQTLMPIISQLPLQISWIDERDELFEQFSRKHPALPGNVHLRQEECVADTIATLPANCWVLIMTHNHQLDYELVSAALKRADCAYIGMIGSDTKARRFTTRLSHQGFGAQDIQRLISPVGLLDVPGKEPINVAVSIAAQLMQQLQGADSQGAEQQQQWRANQQFKRLWEQQT